MLVVIFCWVVRVDGEREDRVIMVGDEEVICDWVVIFSVFIMFEVCVVGDDVVVDKDDIIGWFNDWDCSNS